MLRDNACTVLKVDRGGQVTYHGPGQLIVYLLMDLKRAQLGVRRMVRCIETCVIEWLGSLGISAYGKPSAPGVYTVAGNVEAKIAALGLRVRNGCTYHGLSVNVAMDLSPFADIDPCGYPGLAVTQLADRCVRTVDMRANWRRCLASRFGVAASTDDAATAASENAAGVNTPGREYAHPQIAWRAAPDPPWIGFALRRARASPRSEDPAQLISNVARKVVPEHRRLLRQRHATFMIMGASVRALPFCDVVTAGLCRSTD